MKLNKFKLLPHIAIAFLPSWLKRPLLRSLFGYRIEENVKIGLSLIIADRCTIEKDVSIGHFNVFLGTKRLRIGDNARIGHLNIIRGGDDVDIGRYVEILRLNEINSIPDPIASNPVDPCFVLGDGSIVTTSHKLDFTDRIEIGKRVILGGRNSSLWTHNRQQTKPIFIGDYCYIGSEIRMTPGSSIPRGCIVGIGSVITKPLDGEYRLVGGMPAKAIKPLDEESKKLIHYKTRQDLPNEIG